MPLNLPESVLVLLSFLGLSLSGLFTAVTYRWIRGNSRWIPSFCRIDEETCNRVVDKPQARVFRLPNSVLGLGYYLVLVLLTTTGLLHITGICLLACGVALFTVVLSGYLAYALRVVLRTGCRLCYASHVVNLLIFLALLFACKGPLATLLA